MVGGKIVDYFHYNDETTLLIYDGIHANDYSVRRITNLTPYIQNKIKEGLTMFWNYPYCHINNLFGKNKDTQFNVTFCEGDHPNIFYKEKSMLQAEPEMNYQAYRKKLTEL